MIRVAGFRQTTKNFARTFEPVISREEYTALFLKKQNGNSTSLPTLFAALIEEETDRKLIEELAKMIEERKKELSQDLEKDSKSHDNK